MRSVGLYSARTSGLFRPLMWSAAIHGLVFVAFSVTGGRVFRTMPLGFQINWAMLSSPQRAILLQPQGTPGRVAVLPGVLEAVGEQSPMGRHPRAAAGALDDLRRPLEPLVQALSPRIGLEREGLEWPRKSAEAAFPAAPMGAWGSIRGAGYPLGSPPARVPISDWQDRRLRWPEGRTALDAGIEGPPELLERSLLAYAEPGRRGSGPPATYRFAVAPDGRITQLLPLSAPDAAWAVTTYRTLLGWRFASLPGWAPQQEVWGTVSFE